VPAGGSVTVIQANGQVAPPGGILKFKFSAPAPQVGGYALSFCIGPTSNPCGATNAYVVQVLGGQEQLAVIDAGVFSENVLVVGQGTMDALPFAVTIE
jgi:hypothetical protein